MPRDALDVFVARFKKHQVASDPNMPRDGAYPDKEVQQWVYAEDIARENAKALVRDVARQREEDAHVLLRARLRAQYENEFLRGKLSWYAYVGQIAGLFMYSERSYYEHLGIGPVMERAWIKYERTQSNAHVSDFIEAARHSWVEDQRKKEL